MSNPPEMMACGHAANGVKEPDRNPVCVICDCEEVVAAPDLTGRVARCSYFKTRCQSERPSTDRGLAFFEHRPDREYDEYYCGCYGWD